jgi:hypothetical protein
MSLEYWTGVEVKGGGRRARNVDGRPYVREVRYKRLQPRWRFWPSPRGDSYMVQISYGLWSYREHF